MTLSFHYGLMGAGKSTLALQIGHNLQQRGLSGAVWTFATRSGVGSISSRMGAACDAHLADEETSFAHLSHKDYCIIDEAQFLTREQVDQLAVLADAHDVQVECFGLLTDFRQDLFPGSQALISVGAELRPLPVRVYCECGREGAVSARLVDGAATLDGEVNLVGGIGGESEVTYQVLCRRCFRWQTEPEC